MALQLRQADLHIHTCLSPCGDWDMSPKAVVEKSREKGLELIAVCDHNSAENAAAAMRLGEKLGLCVLPGMEVCSKEEVHILAIFPGLEPALAMQAHVQAHLPGTNKPEHFGYQIIANEENEVTGECDLLLIGASTLNLRQIVDKTHELGGLSIAAHVDRPAFGLISQLGFIPPDLPLDAVEVSFRTALKDAGKKIFGIGHLPCITSSDAHFPDDIGRASTSLWMDIPGFDELCMALQAKEGRRIEILP